MEALDRENSSTYPSDQKSTPGSNLALQQTGAALCFPSGIMLAELANERRPHAGKQGIAFQAMRGKHI